jgi:hypothetical protein
LNAHIENVTAIARQLPFAAVAHHMYSILLGELLKNGEIEVTINADELRMVCAIHREIDQLISYEALATVFLTVLVDPTLSSGETQKATRTERHRLVHRIRWLIRTLSSQLSTSFDGSQLIASLLLLDVSSESWSRSDEEDKARIMFQCAIQTADIAKNDLNSSISASSNNSFRQSLFKCRSMLLSWYCSDFGPRYKGKLKKSAGDSEEVGAGTPDFDSALMQSLNLGSTPSWLRTMRCLLFLEDGDSELMQRFLAPDSIVSEGEWADDAARINICCQFGGTVTDEMIWIVLRSTGIDAAMAISLLENLFANCAKECYGKLKVCDPMIVWELYNLVQYEPSKIVSSPSDVESLENMPRYVIPTLLNHNLISVSSISFIDAGWRIQDCGGELQC